MTPEAWSIIATGIVILIAIATSNRSLRAEFRAEFGGLRRDLEKLSERINQFETSLTERIDQFETSLTERIDQFETSLTERIDQFETSLTERINQLEASLTERMTRIEIELRERLAPVEGVLDVVRDAVIGRSPKEPDALRPRAGSQ